MGMKTTTTSFFHSPEASDGEPLPHQGNILAIWETSETMQVMSDIWDYVTHLHGLVWEPTKGEAFVVTLETAVNNYNLTPQPTAYRVDASPEARTAFEHWYRYTKLPQLAEKIASGRAAFQAGAVGNELTELERVRRGSTVTVVRGRKVPLGITGKVFWIGENQYGMKVGMNLSDRKDERGRNVDVVWTALSNVEVIVNETERKAIEARREAILETGKQGGKLYNEAMYQVHEWTKGFEVGSAHASFTTV